MWLKKEKDVVKVTDKALIDMVKRVEGLRISGVHDEPYDNDPFIVVADKTFDDYYDCLEPTHRFQHAFIGVKNIMCNGVPIVKRSWICQKKD